MKRMTYQSGLEEGFATQEISGKQADGGYFGAAIDKLAKYENFEAHLMTRKSAIPAELDVLRQAGKEKTVAFKERMAEKLMTEMILMQLAKFNLD